MKKIKMVFLIVLMFGLTGCSVPFMGKGNKEIAHFVTKNEDIIQSSDVIDLEVKNQLKKYIESKDDNKQIKEQLKKSKNMQQQLYNGVKNEPSPNGKNSVKYIYLQYIDQRILMYEEFEKMANIEDKKTLTIMLDVYEKTDKLKASKMLKEINIILVEAKQDERVTLAEKPCDGEECNKQKEKKEK